MMLKKGYVKTKNEGFEVFANYRDTEPALPPEDAISAILRSGGHPGAGPRHPGRRVGGR